MATCSGRIASAHRCHYTIAGNEVAVCMEPENLQSFTQAMESQATAEAMAFDGIKRETVKTFVLDKEMKL